MMDKGKRALCMLLLALMAISLSGCSKQRAGVDYAQSIILANDRIRENRAEPRVATALISYRQSGMVGKSAMMIFNYLEEMATNLFMPIKLIWKDEQVSGWEALAYAQTMIDHNRQFLMLYTPEMMIEELAAQADVLSEFSPIAMLAKEKVCFAVAANSPYSSVQDIRSAAQRKPLSVGGLSVAGGLDELRFCRLIGLEEGTYHYQSIDAQTPVAELLNHSVEVLCLPEPQLEKAAAGGEIRIIRSSEPEDEENGLDINWLCLLAPQNTPQLRIDYWRQAFYDFSGSKLWKKTCVDEGWICAYMYGGELGAFLAQQKLALSELLPK